MSGEYAFPLTRHFTGEHAIVQAMDWRRSFRLRYLDTVIGSPTIGQMVTWNTAAYTAELTIRAADDVTIVASTSTGVQVSLGIVTDAAGNESNIRITLPSSLTTGLAPWGLGRWDLFLISGSEREMIYQGDAALEERA